MLACQQRVKSTESGKLLLRAQFLHKLLGKLLYSKDSVHLKLFLCNINTALEGIQIFNCTSLIQKLPYQRIILIKGREMNCNIYAGPKRVPVLDF